MKRQINEDIHDLAHMVSNAKRWFGVAKKIIFRGEKWFDTMDTKIQDIMLREAQRTRKDDK